MVLSLVLLLVVAALVKLNVNESVRELSVPLNIGISYLQLVAFLRIVHLWWPGAASTALSICSLSVLNLQTMAQSRCFISFDTQFWVLMGLPPAFFCVIAMAGGAFVGARRAAQQQQQKQQSQHSGGGQGIANMMLRAFRSIGVSTDRECRILLAQVSLSFLSFAYAVLAWQSVLLFDCVSLPGSDGRRHVRDNVALECGSDAWFRYLPAAILGCVLYVVGIPSLLLWLSCRSSDHAALYLTSQVSSLRSGRFWWFPAQLVWKLALVLVLRLMLSTPEAQVTLCAALFLARGLAVIVARPYKESSHAHTELTMVALSAVVLVCGIVFFGLHGSMADAARDTLVALVVLSLVGQVIAIVAAMVHQWRRTRAAAEKAAEMQTQMSQQMQQQDGAQIRSDDEDKVQQQLSLEAEMQIIAHESAPRDSEADAQSTTATSAAAEDETL